MADEIKDKEDVIETQNEGEIDKENVIEDEVKDDERENDDVMGKIGELFDIMDSMRAEMISMKDSMSQFVEAGGVIHEDEVIDADIDNDGDSDFVPIEALDLSI